MQSRVPRFRPGTIPVFVLILLFAWAGSGAAAPADLPAPAEAWGSGAHDGPLQVVWVLSEGAVPGTVWLLVDGSRVKTPGERIELSGARVSVVVWTLPPGAAVPGGRSGDVVLEVVPEGSDTPAAMSRLGSGLVSGAAPSVVCVDCAGVARVDIDRALALRAAERGRLEPARTDILELTDARLYPNPFNPLREDAAVAFTLSEDAEVTVTVYDWNGDFVDEAFHAPLGAGAQVIYWGGQTEDGRKLGNGTYLVWVVAGNGVRQESRVLKAVVWNED